MTDRVPSDALDTVRGTLARRGATSRLGVRLPDDADLPTGEVVRIILDGSERHARFDARPDGGVTIPGIYDSPSLARDPSGGSDRLREWVEDRTLEAGRTVHLDEIDAGFAYGLRGPGEQTVYDSLESPDDSLASIAENAEGDR